MAITDKTRKISGGRSGSRCAYCKSELILNATSQDDESIIGEECHIVARSADGPRGDSDFPSEKLDSYENLILLCSVHHKMIDDKPNKFSVASLQKLKKRHEKWVSESLGSKSHSQDATSDDLVLGRITTGKDLLNTVVSGHAFSFDHPEPRNEDEANLISSFFEDVQFYGDFGSEIEASALIKDSFRFSQRIKELESNNLYVYGTRYRTEFVDKKGRIDWQIVLVFLARRLYAGIRVDKANVIKAANDAFNL